MMARCSNSRYRYSPVASFQPKRAVRSNFTAGLCKMSEICGVSSMSLLARAGLCPGLCWKSALVPAASRLARREIIPGLNPVGEHPGLHPFGLAFQPQKEHTFVITARLAASIGDENAGCAPASFKQGDRAMPVRHHPTQTTSVEQRFAEEAKRLRKEAQGTPAGVARDTLLRKARQADAASHLSDWMRSLGLQPPK
jgi:hypothetical protein